MDEMREKFEVYKVGFIDAIVDDDSGFERDHPYVSQEEYRIGMQDGMEAVSQHLNFARWKDDYVRRQKK